MIAVEKVLKKPASMIRRLECFSYATRLKLLKLDHGGTQGFTNGETNFYFS